MKQQDAGAQGPWWSPRRLAWLGALFIASMAAQAAYDIWRSYHDAVRDIERDVATQARVIAEQTARGVQAVDLVLKHLTAQLRRGALGIEDAEALHHYLREQAQGLVQTDGLVVFDADGVVRAMSKAPPQPAHKQLVAADAPFSALRDKRVGDLLIDNVQLNATTGRWNFPIGRRAEDRDGRFIGVVGAPGRVEYFEAFYRDTYSDPSTRIALLHQKGWLLARHPQAEAALGKRLEVVGTLLPEGTGTQSAVARLPSPVDGVDHVVALRRVPDYALVVAVSRQAAAALAPWRQQALTTALRTLALGALAAGLLLATLRQLTRAQAARRAAEHSEERYALAMAGSLGGHWVWNTVTDSLFVSDKLKELFGRQPASPTGTRQSFFAAVSVHPEDAARVRGLGEDLVTGRIDRADFEYRIALPDGERWILTRAHRFEDSDGQGVRLAGVSVDVTERHLAEADRRRLEQQLRQAQKLEAIGTLAGGIAHDFNNILSAILGYGELAQKAAAVGTPLRRHIDASIKAGQRAKSLVERILAFSRSGMGERVPVHVQSVVEEALDGIAASLPVGVCIHRRLAAGDAGVLGDATQIHQVVMNLCANAVQSMRGEGRIDVTLDISLLAEPLAVATSTLATGEYLRLAIADSGGGIEPELLDRIFDPFFTTKEVGVGTGLGLSLVHGIVTDLGGGIAVDSRVGEGSRFTVYLPLRVHVAAPRVQVGDVIEHGQGQTVLLVDDEEALVRLGEEALAELGYEPVGHVSSAEALEALRADPRRFDVLLTDVAMPGITGSDLARSARLLRPDLPIVLMSGLVTPALRQRARELGVAEVLSKPLAAAAIARALASALRGLRAPEN